MLNSSKAWTSSATAHLQKNEKLEPMKDEI